MFENINTFDFTKKQYLWKEVRVVLFTITATKISPGYGITCAIPCSEKRDRNHPIVSIYSIPVEKIYI